MRFEGSLSPEISVSQSKTALTKADVPVVTFDELADAQLNGGLAERWVA